MNPEIDDKQRLGRIAELKVKVNFIETELVKLNILEHAQVIEEQRRVLLELRKEIEFIEQTLWRDYWLA